MNVLKIENKTHVLCLGDIHGEIHVINKVIEEQGIKDTCIILLGDAGVGFYKNGIEIWSAQQRLYHSELLELTNNCIVVIRGNHDDPQFFRHISCVGLIYFVPDYTMLEVANKNILCIGGGVSIDRKARKEGVSYWSKEITRLNERALDDICEYYDEIHAICSHDAPSFVFPNQSWDNLQYWINNDPKLVRDVEENRNTLTSIYYSLATYYAGTLEAWYHGHFHKSHTSDFGRIKIYSLNINETKYLTKLDSHDIKSGEG